MWRVGILSLLGVFAVVVQALLLCFGWPVAILPQLVVIVVVYLGFNEIGVLGAFVAFLLGLFLDLSSAVLVGPWAGALAALYGILAILSARIFIESTPIAVLLTCVATLVSGAVYMLLAGQYRSWDLSDILQVITQAIATAVVAPVCLGMIANRLKRRTSAVSGRSIAVSGNS